ncbi:beta-xylosidase [Geomicrobium halophilum]|uniref:Beta-xylosidase n=1 Tax=Geomicrobium halophilum TaxID=549000 RepID=A0A841Q0Q8_9BACL|nr:hypothetical protein [Geomicrobium halophilum]MBB6450925.1 beta-xylosidase [Geomicrobium halophilum]
MLYYENEQTTLSLKVPNLPEGKLDMTGDIGEFIPGEIDDPVHDSSIIQDGDTYYVFSTGILDEEDPGGIYVRKSNGSLEGPWESLGEVPLPEWTLDYNVEHLWAPQVVKNDDTYYLYDAASSFGTNDSAIITHGNTRRSGKLGRPRSCFDIRIWRSF